MEALYAIDGAGWSVSFQRRVGGANRGALPYHLLFRHADRIRVVVPLQKTEALWIAVMAEPGIVVAAQAGHDPLCGEEVSGNNSVRTLYALDGIIRFGQQLPLDAATLEIADEESWLEHDVLTVVLTQRTQAAICHIGIIPVTPRLYSALSGVPAPPLSSESDQYGGWRLP